MPKEAQDEISKILGVEPIKINSNLVSCQNRSRLYWTNIPNVEQPIQKNIIPKDILEEYVGKEYIINKKPEYNYTNFVTWLDGKGNVNSSYCRAWKIDKKLGTLSCSNRTRIFDNEKCIVRYITPVEAERTQTLPDNYTQIVQKDNLRYKLIGNGWTVDVIAHIFSFLKGV